MKDFPSQAEYLSLHFDPATMDQIHYTTLKKTYRKLYQQEYRKRHQQRQKRFTLRLSAEQYKRFQQLKKEHRRTTLSQFIIDSALAYHDKGYLAHDETKVEALEQQLQKIGNNINQVVYKLHKHMVLVDLDGRLDTSTSQLRKLLGGYELLFEQVKNLEKELHAVFQTPPATLMGLSWDMLRDDIPKLKSLISFLLHHVDERSS